jgi:hypothetical protein
MAAGQPSPAIPAAARAAKAIAENPDKSDRAIAADLIAMIGRRQQ